ncbi:CheR family methyltransferase [Thioalkalivibrio sp. XN279]|uniref:CheR family methyltransferase n=1 Tax=Thioalkalivibrio sp. XN279 TaxID=2714953 RepID=UPI00351AF98B
MSAVEKEFDFSDRDFDEVRRLIHKHAGIALHPGKRHMVYSRVARRLRATRLTRFDQYLSRLESDRVEWQNFVNSLTTNLTAFFRESHHFPLLAEHVQQHCRGREVVIWSAACSTGEEAWSIAMTMVDAFGTFTPPVKIVATDVDTNVLMHAEEGVYSTSRISGIPEQDVKRFFLRGKGAREGLVKVRPELMELVTFRPLNLLAEEWSVRPPVDAIFCRNVMIYFDKPTQRRVLERFVPLLRPEGLLFAGHAESFSHAADLFRARGKTVYTLTGAK